MNLSLRRCLSAPAVALTCVVVAFGPATAASADEIVTEPVLCQDQVVLDQLAAAQAAEDAARLVFTGRNGSLAHLVKEERAAVRAAAKESREQLRQLAEELRAAVGGKEAARVRRELAAERRALAKAERLLQSPRLLRDEARAERLALKQAWDEAKLVLREAEAALAACEAAAQPEPEPLP